VQNPTALTVDMAKSKQWQEIPTSLSVPRFDQFVLPHLTRGRRGPPFKLSLHAIFNYVLRLLYTGCQWKELPIEKGKDGRPEIHYTSIYRAFRRWVADGCFDAIFTGSVLTLAQHELLNTTVVHGDGTTTAAKKGGDNIGFNGHKRIKGDKVVPFCDRNCNVVSPFVAAPGNRNESLLLRPALAKLTGMARAVGIELRGSIISLDGRLRLPRQSQSHFQPWDDAQHQRERARQEDHQARAQAAVRCGNLQGAVPHHRTCVRLGGQVSPRAESIRGHQRSALRL
jgi:transposase